MKLLIILIALAVERFGHLGNFMHRFRWFKAYMDLMHRGLEKSGLWKGIVGVALAALPLLIAVAIVFYLLAWTFFGLTGFLLALIILYYCLGPDDIYTDFEAYFISTVQGVDENTENKLAKILTDVPSETSLIPRAVTKAVFHEYNRRIFAVIFWFIVLGPLGAVLYRVIAEIYKLSQQKNYHATEMQTSAHWLVDLLD